VGNNPIGYSDPTGHMRVEEMVEKRGCRSKDYCEKGKPKTFQRPKPPISGTSIGPAPYVPNLVGYSSGLAPSTATSYEQQVEESSCGGCSMEPTTPNGGGGPALIALMNDPLTAGLNGEAVNAKDIPVYVNIVTNPDGSTSVPSILIDNKIGSPVSVMKVTFQVNGGSGCNFSSAQCMTAAPYSYRVASGPGIYHKGITPGLGVAAPNSMQNISISPSGYPNNPSNTFHSGFKITINLGNSNTGQIFIPISVSFP
jgi:hypothetical protein